MIDPFEKKVRAAAVAGWWVILIGYALLLVTWVVYLAIMSARPGWLLTMWGQGDVSWSLVQNCVTVVHGRIQVVHVVSVSGGPLADAVGEAVA